jgi:hypothetical protein
MKAIFVPSGEIATTCRAVRVKATPSAYTCHASTCSRGRFPNGGRVFRPGVPRDERGQVVALHQLHDQGAHASCFFDPVEVRDVRVVQGRQHPRLALEARQPLGILREEVRQNLQRDVAPQLRVARAIDLAHSACPERRDDLVRTQPRARIQ